MTIEMVYMKNNPKDKFQARYVVRQGGTQVVEFALDSDNLGRGARKAALKQAQDYCKTHFQIIPEHRGSDRYTLTSEAPTKMVKEVKPKSVTPIDKKQPEQKLQGRKEVKQPGIPLDAAARSRVSPRQANEKSGND